MTGRGDLYGLMVEFHDPHAAVEAARAVTAAGYKKVDAYSPYPNEELSEALQLPKSHVPKLVLLGGCLRPARRVWPRVLGVGNRLSR